MCRKDRLTAHSINPPICTAALAPIAKKVKLFSLAQTPLATTSGMPGGKQIARMLLNNIVAYGQYDILRQAIPMIDMTLLRKSCTTGLIICVAHFVQIVKRGKMVHRYKNRQTPGVHNPLLMFNHRRISFIGAPCGALRFLQIPPM